MSLNFCAIFSFQILLNSVFGQQNLTKDNLTSKIYPKSMIENHFLMNAREIKKQSPKVF